MTNQDKLKFANKLNDSAKRFFRQDTNQYKKLIAKPNKSKEEIEEILNSLKPYLKMLVPYIEAQRSGSVTEGKLIVQYTIVNKKIEELEMELKRF